MQKYAFDEARPVLERASARETAARVALGRVASQLPRAGGRRPDRLPRDRARRRPRARRALAASRTTWRGSTTTRSAASTRTPAKQMVERIDQAHEDGDTLGGVVEVVVHGLPPGLGLARALGPAARLAARRRADGHPGDQGRRGRRRLRARGDARARWPTTRWCRHDDGIRRRQRPLRRHRGRHDHRRGAPGPRRDEADRDRAPGAPHRRRRHRRGGGRPPPALRRLRGTRRRDRRRGDGRAGAGRRGAGEVRRRLRRRRPGATPSRYLDTLRFK